MKLKSVLEEDFDALADTFDLSVLFKTKLEESGEHVHDWEFTDELIRHERRTPQEEARTVGNGSIHNGVFKYKQCKAKDCDVKYLLDYKLL